MYKQIKPLEKTGRMLVNEEQSTIIQEYLIEMGYKWSMGQKRPIHVKEPILFWDDDKEITYGNEGDKAWFDGHALPLHTFTDYFEPLK